jgi:hypothetical protein
MRKLVLALTLTLLVAVSLFAQSTLVNETSTSMSGVTYTPLTSTGHFADGTYVTTMLAKGYLNGQEVIVEVAGEPGPSYLFLPITYTVTSQFSVYTVNVDPFSVATQYGHTVNVTLLTYQSRLTPHRGSDGAHSWTFLGGTEDVTIR